MLLLAIKTAQIKHQRIASLPPTTAEDIYNKPPHFVNGRDAIPAAATLRKLPQLLQLLHR
jgi:hypothetical protein